MSQAAKKTEPLISAMTGVRRFVEDDVPRVADLHRRVFATADASTAGWMDWYRRYFTDVFPAAAPNSDGVSSLVYQEGSDITGFLGVRPRRMLFEERPITMAVSSQFAVDPARRGVAGLRILRQLLDGPQDFTLTDEAGDYARRLWEWSGGTTALMYSIDWVRPLRPARAALSVLLGHRSPRLARMSAPIARMVDVLCDKLALGPLRPQTPVGSREELDEVTLAPHLPQFMEGRSLRPDYGDGSLRWILERASTRRVAGACRKVVVKDEKQEIAGWYLYFANRGGVGEVVHVGARRNAIGQVLDHLIDDGLRSGVTALSGRLDPAFAKELAERDCLLYRRGFWALIHSRHPKLLRAIERGDAFLTRVEGEWCLRFQ